MPGQWVEIVNAGEPAPPVELDVHQIGGGDVAEDDAPDEDDGPTLPAAPEP